MRWKRNENGEDHPEHMESNRYGTKKPSFRVEDVGLTSRKKKTGWHGSCQTRRIRKKKGSSGRTELPLVRIATVGDPMKPGMAHEKVNAFHSGSFLIIVTIDVSESPVPLFVSTGGPNLIPLVWKAIEFTGSDVGPQ